jgi:hypothetical protein
MDMIAGRRASGKTTLLIKMSADGKGRIVEPTQKQAEYVKLMAKRMGLDIPEPISFSEMLNSFYADGHYYSKNREEKFLLDEVQTALGQLGVTVATLDNSCIKYLPENN